MIKDKEKNPVFKFWVCQKRRKEMRTCACSLCFILCNKHDMYEHTGGGVRQSIVRRGMTLCLLLLALSMCHS